MKLLAGTRDNTHKAVFQRTHLTWLAYILLGYFAYLQASVGPLMTFLRVELHLDYTVEGLHFSAFAFGALLVGLTGNHVVRLVGRKKVFWGGGIGMAVGTLLLVVVHQALLTLGSIVIMGYMGNLLLMAIQATLSDQHREQRAVALLEANVIASIGASLAPLSIGISQASGIGWRGALVLVVIIFVIIALSTRRMHIPDATTDSTTQAAETLRRAFPLTFWLYWLVVTVGVAIEWCMVFWGADYFVRVGAVSRESAATLMTSFFVAEIIGRLGGSRLARVIDNSRLVLLAILVTAPGFLLFWLVPLLPLRILGLILAGLGIANLYPLGVALTLSVVPRRADSGSARVALGSGIAVIIVPLVLGWFADQAGLQIAYGIVALLLLVVITLIIVANGLARKTAATPA